MLQKNIKILKYAIELKKTELIRLKKDIRDLDIELDKTVANYASLTDCVLTPRERDFMSLRFGVKSRGGKMTYKEIGRLNNVTQERVRQIISRAMRNIEVFLLDTDTAINNHD